MVTVHVTRIDAETIRQHNISFQLAETQMAPTAGLHFGSRLIVDEEVQWTREYKVARVGHDQRWRRFATSHA